MRTMTKVLMLVALALLFAGPVTADGEAPSGAMFAIDQPSCEAPTSSGEQVPADAEFAQFGGCQNCPDCSYGSQCCGCSGSGDPENECTCRIYSCAPVVVEHCLQSGESFSGYLLTWGVCEYHSFTCYPDCDPRFDPSCPH